MGVLPGKTLSGARRLHATREWDDFFYVAEIDRAAGHFFGVNTGVECEHTSATGAPPTADSFRIEVADAGTIDDKPTNNASVSVGAVRPIAP